MKTLGFVLWKHMFSKGAWCPYPSIPKFKGPHGELNPREFTRVCAPEAYFFFALWSFIFRRSSGSNPPGFTAVCALELYVSKAFGA